MAPVSQGVFMTLIPRTDLDVFPLNLGGNTFGWTSDRETSFAVLDAYVAAGGNFIDTADGYSAWVEGHRSEERRVGKECGDGAGAEYRRGKEIGTKVENRVI